MDNLDNLLLIRATAGVVPFSAEGCAFSAEFLAKGSHFEIFRAHTCSPGAAGSQSGQSGQSFTDKGSRRRGAISAEGYACSADFLGKGSHF